MRYFLLIDCEPMNLEEILRMGDEIVITAVEDPENEVHPGIVDIEARVVKVEDALARYSEIVEKLGL